MTPQHFQQVKRVFQDALDLPVAQRRQFVSSACAGDEELRIEVESLLASEDTADFIAEPAANFSPSGEFEEQHDAEVGSRIGPYKVLSEIGSGGMGSVYLAERIDEFHQKVAVKLMRRGMDSRMIVSRFRHERQILAALNHPNIARLLDGGATEDGRPYFIMEHVEGSAIDTYAAAHALGIEDRLKLFCEVCSAVQYAHQNLIVHRDLKPGNILVTADGTPKLLDFGIAKLLRPLDAQNMIRGETLAMTQAGIRLMTPEYASPEQARGLPITTASDVYSLGVILYQLLTGKMPYQFATRSPLEIERTICETEARQPSSVVEKDRSARLAGDLDTITLKALEKDPQRRYASVEQLRADVRRHLDGIPVQARPQTFGYRAGRFVRRNKLGVTAAALVVLSLAGGLGVAAWQAHIAGQQRARAERRFNDVRQLAHSFLFDFHDSIKNLPGSTAARKLVVQRALEYLGSLSAEAANDPALQRELAEAYLRVGDVQGNPTQSNLGDISGALQSYEKALAIARDVVQRDPRDVESQEYLARAHLAVGDIRQLQSDPAGSVPEYRESIRILEGLPNSDPSTRRELATAYDSLGDILGHSGIPNLGNPEGGKEAYEKALAIDQALMAQQPENPRARQAVAVTQMKIGDMDLQAGDAAGGLRLYQIAAATFEALSMADPLNAPARRTVAVATRKLGEAYEAAGKSQAALDQYVKAAEIDRRLMQSDPKDSAVLSGYTVALKNRADLLYKTGQKQASFGVYREVLEIVARQSQAEPSSILLKSRHAEMLADVGSLLAGQGRKEEAAQLYREGLQISHDLADRPGATPDDLFQYAEQLLTCPLPEVARPAEAIPYARRAAEMTKERISENLEQLARAYFAAGDSSNAITYEQKALALIPAASLDRKDAEARLARFQAGLKKK